MAENYGNPTVFLQPTNQNHFPLPGQFGLASSDYMYGIQRPEFSQCASPHFRQPIVTVQATISIITTVKTNMLPCIITVLARHTFPVSANNLLIRKYTTLGKAIC
jgi:hypothetical protein